MTIHFYVTYKCKFPVVTMYPELSSIISYHPRPTLPTFTTVILPPTWSHGLSLTLLDHAMCFSILISLSVMPFLQLFYFMSLDSFFKTINQNFSICNVFYGLFKTQFITSHWNARIFCILYISLLFLPYTYLFPHKSVKTISCFHSSWAYSKCSVIFIKLN